MRAPFRRLAVLGLGLLGGSLALAARRAGAVRYVVGCARRPGPLADAVAAGVIDEALSVADAVTGADLVVLAAPVAAMPALLREAAPALETGAIVTDVGSVKGLLAEVLPGLLPAGVHYVGSHPMAGSHEKGVAFARADLFEGAACAVCAPSGAAAEARERVAELWRALGARVVIRDPETHDEDVAWTSHVPHALAFAFAASLARAPESAADLVGAGFRDFTRIAGSDAELWGDILASNKKALAGPLQAVAASLDAIARAIESGDVDELERFIGGARDELASLSNPTAPSALVARKSRGGHEE